MKILTIVQEIKQLQGKPIIIREYELPDKEISLEITKFCGVPLSEITDVQTMFIDQINPFDTLLFWSNKHLYNKNIKNILDQNNILYETGSVGIRVNKKYFELATKIPRNG